MSLSRDLCLAGAAALLLGAACGDDDATPATSSSSASSSSTSAGQGGASTSTTGGGGEGAGSTGGAGGSQPLPETALLVVGSGNWGGGAIGTISVFRYTFATSMATELDTTALGNLPGFMAVDAERRLLHVGDEVAGTMRTLEVGADGTVTERSSTSSVGNPVHLALDPSGMFLFAAHYGPGRTEVFSLDDNGWIDSSLDSIATGGQTHSTLVPGTDHLFAASKEDDHVARLSFDGNELSDEGTVATAPGSGPRHLAMHPNGTVVYLVNELDRTLDAYNYEGTNLTPLQVSLSLDPPGQPSSATGADVHVHPSGGFLYASLRHNGADGELVRFSIASDGTPTLAGRTSTGGQTPRNFAIDPTGRSLAVANQNSDNLVLADIGGEGGLTTTQTLDVAAHPFFVTFLLE